MTPDRFRIAAWVVSGLCLALSTGLIVNRHAAFIEAAKRNGRAGADLQQAREEASAVARQPIETKFACAPRKADEETEFLIDLRRRAKSCGVSIARWSSHATTYQRPANASGPADPNAPNKILEGITKVSCEVALDGSYASLRALLRDIWKADRLFTVSDVDWSRTEKGSELAMTLGRYVAPEPPKAASSGISEGAPKS